MKTLHFCMSEAWGGLEMASAQWATLFIKHGHEALSICAPETPLENRLKERNLPYVTRQFNKYFSPMDTLWLRRYVIENKVEAVFLQNLRDLWVVSPALWGLNIKLVGFAQMWLSNISKKDPLHTLMHNRLTTLVTLTAAHSQQTLKCLPVPLEKAFIAPNSIDTSLFGPERRNENLRNEFGAQVSDFLIGIVGRLDRQKGQKEVLDAFAELKKRHPEKSLKLVFVGEATRESEGMSYEAELREDLQKANLSEHVKFAGFKKNIPEVMASLDVFILASYQEAFGFVVVEALASRTPVIATDSGGVPDILEHGKQGLLIEPKSSSAITEALESIINDPVKSLDRAQKARAYAQETFDENKVFFKLLKHLESAQ
ncbi:MAG: glycosyltransferase family 4 protein [Bdellovibrionaceae bacterium]|nr:glycosyltransferase family 4 protein [Pseudobdellovibrionaceae bacterium]